MATNKYKNNFGFYKTHLYQTNAAMLDVDTSSEALEDIDSGELITMIEQVPTKLTNDTDAGVAKYLVAEDYKEGNPYIVVYLLQPIHEIIGDYNAEELSVGDDVLVHESKFDEVGEGQEAQGILFRLSEEDKAIVKLK